jgi:hypothetical protein
MRIDDADRSQTHRIRPLVDFRCPCE